MRYHLGEIAMIHGLVHMDGWAAPADKNARVMISLRDEHGAKLDARVNRVRRPDVAKAVYGKEEDLSLGFHIIVAHYDKMYIVFEVLNDEGAVIRKSAIYIRKSALKGRIFLEKTGVLRGYRYWKRNGLKETIRKTHVVLFHRNEQDYNRWFLHHKASDSTLEYQRTGQAFEKQPLISIVVPLYHTPERFLNEMVESVLAQTYGNWQLCMANGSPEDEKLKSQLAMLASKDSRILVTQLEKNMGISGNTNAALALATGDYIALLDHDDLLAPNTLYEYVRMINQADEEVDMLYCDEDKIDQDSKIHFEPHFKSDYNRYLFLTNNYICHFFMVKRSIAEKIGGFSSEYDGSQDYDFIIRCIEAGNTIYHVPKILYHWRCHVNSTAQNPESKNYAYEAGKRALQAHFDRMGMDVTTHIGAHRGWYSNEYRLPYHPLLTIMIPNKDHVEDLSKCLDSLFDHASYDHYEILIIENNSTEAKTFAYYEKLKKEHENLRVVVYEGPFNYSAINNFGFSYANGEYVLLLNNDTELITENALEHMLGFAMQKNVGIVGAKLYYADDTIQHAGVVVGVQNIASHAFLGVYRSEPGYMARAIVCQNYSAVTGACMMVRSSLYKELGGLDEEQYAVAFNDIDFCLRVGQAGYDVVLDAEAEWYHYESKSRGSEDTIEKLKRFNKEIACFKEQYAGILENGDPYYNINFSRKMADFTIEYDHPPVSATTT